MPERSSEALYKAFSEAAPKGNAYVCKEPAARVYGKLEEPHQLEVRRSNGQDETRLSAFTSAM